MVFFVKINDQKLLLKVTISSENTTNFITFEKEVENQFSYQIKNETDFKITVF